MTSDEKRPRTRQRSATGGAVAYADFLKAAGTLGPQRMVASSLPSPPLIPKDPRPSAPQRPRITTVTFADFLKVDGTLPPRVPLMAGAKDGCHAPVVPVAEAAGTTHSANGPEEQRRQTAERRLAAFANILPKAEPAEPSKHVNVAPPCVDKMSALVPRIPEEVSCHSTSIKEEAVPGVPDYPAWLVEPDLDEAEYEVVDLPFGGPVGGPNHCAGCAKPLALFSWSSSGEGRHRCALCGGGFCDRCSSYYTILPHLGRPIKQRACKGCHMRATGNRTPHPDLLEARGCRPATLGDRLAERLESQGPLAAVRRWLAAAAG
eukprot:EG_transcript_8572